MYLNKMNIYRSSTRTKSARKNIKSWFMIFNWCTAKTFERM